MNHSDIYKLVFDQGGFLLGLEYHTGGKSLRILSDEKPREGLYVAASRVLAIGIALYELPEKLNVGFKSISFSNGDDPGSIVQAEGFEKKVKLILPKISNKEIYKTIAGDYSVDPENLQNIFNLAVRELKEEILVYIRGQRQQLSFEFNAEQEELFAKEGEEILKMGEKIRKRAAADRVVSFPGNESAAQ